MIYEWIDSLDPAMNILHCLVAEKNQLRFRQLYTHLLLALRLALKTLVHSPAFADTALAFIDSLATFRKRAGQGMENM